MQLPSSSLFVHSDKEPPTERDRQRSPVLLSESLLQFCRPVVHGTVARSLACGCHTSPGWVRRARKSQQQGVCHGSAYFNIQQFDIVIIQVLIYYCV